MYYIKVAVIYILVSLIFLAVSFFASAILAYGPANSPEEERQKTELIWLGLNCLWHFVCLPKLYRHIKGRNQNRHTESNTEIKRLLIITLLVISVVATIGLLVMFALTYFSMTPVYLLSAIAIDFLLIHLLDKTPKI